MATALALPQNADADYGGPGFPDLPIELQKELKSLLRKALQREMYARRQEVMEARKQRFYDRDVQYIFWDWQAWGYAPLQGAAWGYDNQNDSNYEDVYPIYHPFLRAIVAAMTANSPGAHVVASTNRTADTVAAEAADDYREFIERANKIKQVQTEIARLFCTDGRVVTEVYTSEPDIRYGRGEDGEPLQAEIIGIYGTLESKVPITQNNFAKWPYCVLSKEFDTEILQAEYPNCVDDKGNSTIKESGTASGETTYERMARLGVLQGTRLMTASGETWQHLVTKHTAYFRPAFFRAASKENRERLEQIFPDGCRVVVCGDTYCESENVSMDQRVKVAHATPGDGQARISLLHGLVGLQDTFNDCWNQQKEIFDYCIPQVYMDQQTLDAAARTEQKSEPGAEFPVLLQPGEAIQEKIMFGQNVEVPATMVQALQILSGELAQLVTGMYQVAMGSGDSHQETAKGLMILKESSLGQMGLAWGSQQELTAAAIEDAIRLAASTRDENERIPVKIDSETREVEIANIQKGNFYVEVDTSFPDTRAMKRAIFESLLESAQKSPAMMAILTLPENQELFKEFVGIKGFAIPGAKADEQQRREIEELLASEPVAPSPEEVQAAIVQMAQKTAPQIAAGGPMPPPPDPQAIAQSLTKPSVGIDPEWDMHAQHIQVITNWLASQERYDEEAKGNFQGIENVKLHGEMHKQALKAQQQPAQGKPPSVSINFKDLPPDGKVEAAQEAGIPINPAGVIAQEVQKSAPKPPTGEPNA